MLSQTLADLWSLSTHHVPETSFGLALFTLILTQTQRRRDHRKAAIEAGLKAQTEAKVLESDRADKLAATLRNIEQVTDPLTLQQIVTFGRSLAKNPKPIKYESSFNAPIEPGGEPNILPVIDETEERFLVEQKYYANRFATVPCLPTAVCGPDGFPDDIPEEWYPSLVNGIISTLPARYPAYHNLANADAYGPHDPRMVIQRLTCLADAVEHPYLHVSQHKIAEFIVTAHSDHWSNLPTMIQSLLTPDGERFPNLGAEFLHLAGRGHRLKAYWPNIVQLAVVLGVSESVYRMRHFITEDQKTSLAASYTSLLKYGALNGLGPHRLWHHSLYCTVDSWAFETHDGETVEVGRFEVARDHEKGTLSIDRVLAAAVLAMGVVAPSSPWNPEGGAGHYTMRIVQFLPKVFDSYRLDPRTKRLIKDSGTEMPYASRLDSDCADDFVEGINNLARQRQCGPEVQTLIESASILVPDIRERLRDLDDDTSSCAS